MISRLLLVAFLATCFSAALAFPTSAQTRAVPFDQKQGTLPYPVQGRIVVGFGEPTSHGISSKGLVFEPEQQQVVSPCDGLVTYADEFRNYGRLVILSAADGYHFLLGGFARIDAQLGQSVRSGEPIGVVRTASGAVSPAKFYVELRKDGDALDPSPWWRKN